MKMNSKTIASIVVFAALTVALALSPIKVPAPYAPYLIYQIWEIPIVAVFLLYNPLIGVAIAIINTMVLLAVFPGSLPAGPFYNLFAVLSTLLGIYIIHKLLTKRFNKQQEAIFVTFSTLLGIIMRVGIMTIINWILLQYPYPVGFSMIPEAVIATLPILGIFNASIALYTIPLGHIIAKAVRSAIKIL
jgi:riboflavin transporter FmnP